MIDNSTFCHDSLPPKSCNEIGRTGGCTFNGRSLEGASPVISWTTLSTAGLHVRPPQKPIPALVRHFNSLALQLNFSAVSSNSFKETSSQRQMTKSCI